jgi:predicted CoA-binding protein
MSLTTVVLGASEKPHRYAHLAVVRLIADGEKVIAIGKRAGRIGSTPIVTVMPADERVDTVTVYLSAANQSGWADEMMRWHPRRVIFNPGAENAALAGRLKASGVEVIQACTLVMLSSGEYTERDQRAPSDRLG